MSPPLLQHSPKQETPNPSMEHFSTTYLHNQLPYNTLSHHELQQFSYLGLFQENASTNNTALLSSLNEVNPQESLTRMVYNDYDYNNHDPFSCFVGGSNEGHDFGGEGGYDGNGMMEYLKWEMRCDNGNEIGCSKSKNCEKQRRMDYSNKYSALMSLLPNRTKGDRVSVLGGAIEYIKELIQTVNHLKLVLDKKKRLIDRTKKLKAEHNTAENIDGSDMNLSDAQDQSCNGSLRSCWLQSKSKDTEVDVKVVNDEVNIKFVQLKKSNCLLCISKILDELELDVQHVAGGCVGDFNSFMFNTKIYNEGGSMNAGAIAKRLIESVEAERASSAPPTSCSSTATGYRYTEH